MEITGLFQQIEAIYLLYGYQLVFLSSFVETSPLGWTIPGGLLVAAGGFYAYGSGLSLILVVISAWVGMLLTLLVAYFIGTRTGVTLAERFGQEKNAQRAKILLENHGATILTTSLMANLTRFWVAYIAGAQKYSFVRFLFYSAAASLTWTSLLVTVGYLAGTEKQQLEQGVARLGIVSWVLVIVALAVIYWKIRSEFLKLQNEQNKKS